MINKFEKYVLVDLLDERGHERFNQVVVSNFLTYNKNGLFLKMPIVIKKLLLLKGRLRAIYYLTSFFYALYILLRYRNYKLIVLSYNLVTMSLASKFRVVGEPVYLFEHNTFVPGNCFKLKFFKFINSSFIHLAFEEYISQKIHELERKSIVYPHPRLELPTSEKCIDFLMVSGTVPEVDVDSLVDLLAGFNAVSLVKDRFKRARKLGCVETFSYLEDYEGTISQTRYVVIPQKFDFRVSGVFYDVILNVDIVYLKRSLFAENMFKIFPNKVYIFDEFSDIVG